MQPHKEAERELPGLQGRTPHAGAAVHRHRAAGPQQALAILHAPRGLGQSLPGLLRGNLLRGLQAPQPVLELPMLQRPVHRITAMAGQAIVHVLHDLLGAFQRPLQQPLKLGAVRGGSRGDTVSEETRCQLSKTKTEDQRGGTEWSEE